MLAWLNAPVAAINADTRSATGIVTAAPAAAAPAPVSPSAEVIAPAAAPLISDVREPSRAKLCTPGIAAWPILIRLPLSTCLPDAFSGVMSYPVILFQRVVASSNSSIPPDKASILCFKAKAQSSPDIPTSFGFITLWNTGLLNASFNVPKP